jgi:transposase
MIDGEEMMDFKDLKRRGLTITRIAEISGRDRKTVRKYLERAKPPAYASRPGKPSKLDPFKPYVRTRMDQGMTNGVKMLAEIRKRGYEGSVTILKDFMRPYRPVKETAIKRFETSPGKQAQVDWGHCGKIFREGKLKALYCFAMTLSYSRHLYIEFTTSQDTTTFLRCHINAFNSFGGVTKEILYDNTKSAIIRRFLKKIELNPRFADMAAHYGFIPRFCRPYRAQTKGKVESAIKYIKRNFLAGENFASLEDINAASRVWLATVANVRVHGTTGEAPAERFVREDMMSIKGVAPFDPTESTIRRVSLDCLVSYRGSRYSVPYLAAKEFVAVKEDEDGVIHMFFDSKCIACHRRAKKGETVIVPGHYQGIASATTLQPKPLLIHGLENSPIVQERDLSVYEGVLV